MSVFSPACGLKRQSETEREAVHPLRSVFLESRKTDFKLPLLKRIFILFPAFMSFEKSAAYNLNIIEVSFHRKDGSTMFESAKRYVTRGVASSIGLDIQLILWSLIDKRKELGVTLDYLQIFALSEEDIDGVKIQKIIHSQEQPEVKDAYLIPMAEPATDKIWVIDSGDYSTMLFPKEY